MYPYVQQFKSLNEIVNFAKINVDRENGAAFRSIDGGSGMGMDARMHAEMMRRAASGFFEPEPRFRFSPPPYMPSDSDRNSEWTDNYGFDEYINDYYNFNNKNGIDNRVAKIKHILIKYVEQYRSHFIPQNIFNEYHDVSGGIVDIATYIENDPCCMINFGDNATKKAINIVFQMGGSAIQSDEIKLIGLIIFCLNDILKNRTINLYGCHNTSDKMYIFFPLISSFTDVVTPQIELVLLNLKAFFRRIIFAVKEGAPPEIRKDIGIYLDGGYGHSENIREKDIVNLFKINPDIIITAEMVDNVNDIDSVCKKIIEKIVKSKDGEI